MYLHAHRGVQLSREELRNLKFKPYTFMPDHDDIPLKWFECQSILSRRIAILTIQVRDDRHVNIIWSGDTFAYRGALGDNNVPGCVHAFACWICNLIVVFFCNVHRRAVCD